MSRRWTNISLFLLGGIVAFVLLLIVFINTGAGQRTVASLIGSLSDNRVVITGLSGSLPYSPRAERVEIRDDTGTWLVVENVTVDWSPLPLLWNRVDVERAEADRVSVLRLPVEDNDETGSTPAIDVRALRIERLETTAEVSKTPAAVTVQGAVRFASLDDWAADIMSNRLDAMGTYQARASLENSVLTGTADIQEPTTGLLAGLLGLNDIGAIEAHLTGSGPRDANAIRLTLTAGPMQA